MADIQPVSWMLNTNVYEVNLRQYTTEGSFSAFQAHLPRLKRMGVETLWFMPITPIAKQKMLGTMGSYYACTDYTAVNPEFGTLDDFKALVREAHSLGMKVIMDWVANHTGWDHVWTKTHPEYFERDTQGRFVAAEGMEDIIELDFDNPQMEEAMISAMAFWVNECNLDGFRCDLAFWVPLSFWQKARPRLDAIKPLFWLGEFDPLDTPQYLQMFDSAYTWKWMHDAGVYYIKNRNTQILKDLLHQYDAIFNVEKTGLYFTTNHDENSWNGTEYEKYGEMAKALAVFSCTWQGIPLIYSGQEIPNTKRILFFDKDALQWPEEPALESFYTRLLQWRSQHPAIKTNVPAYCVEGLVDTSILAFTRQEGDAQILVILNLSPYPAVFHCGNVPVLKGQFSELFTNQKIVFPGDITLSLPEWGYQVWYTK